MEVSAWSHSVLSKFDDILLLPALAEHENDVPKRKWIDERGRIRIWTTNTGAHHRGDSSLDYRLRDAPVIKNQTIKILQRLQQLFETLEEVLNEDGGETTTEEEEEALRLLQDQLDDDENIADLEFNESEVSHIFKTVVETITQLYQISVAISPLSDHDRLMQTENLDYVLEAIHKQKSILSKVFLTSTSRDPAIQQIYLRYNGTQCILPVPKVSGMKGMMAIGEIRATAGEFFSVTDLNRVKLIFEGSYLNDDTNLPPKGWFEHSQPITCLIMDVLPPPRGD